MKRILSLLTMCACLMPMTAQQGGNGGGSSALSSLPAGIYIFNGKKVTIK